MSSTEFLRPIRRVSFAPKLREGGGFIVRRPVGGANGYCDPFLLLDHFGPTTYGPGEAIGAPSHPHRGFETVSYLLEGSIVHKDSHGNTGTLSDGDVQWMTAGSGIVHSEMPSEDVMKYGGSAEGFQLWVNLPARDKMTRPRYQDTPAEKIPVLESNHVFVKVIAGTGTLAGKTVTSPIETRFPILLMDVRLRANRVTHDIALPADLDGFVYAYRGSGTVNGQEVEEGRAALLGPSNDKQDGIIRIVSAPDQELRVLVACGTPLKEPIYQYGPFVMNTREEMIQTVRDFESGSFGSIDGGNEEMKLTQQARMAQKISGRWNDDSKDL